MALGVGALAVVPGSLGVWGEGGSRWVWPLPHSQVPALKTPLVALPWFPPHCEQRSGLPTRGMLLELLQRACGGRLLLSAGTICIP